MKVIEFTGAFGFHNKTILLVAPNGTYGFWQLLIDNYYKGIIVKRKDTWEGHTNEELTADDLLILGEIIEKNTTT
jgi:hypothetical protein